MVDDGDAEVGTRLANEARQIPMGLNSFVLGGLSLIAMAHGELRRSFAQFELGAHFL
jgi:hypothetical protein